MLHKWFEPKAEPKSWNHLKAGRNHFVFISLSSVWNSFFLLVKWLYETSSADCSPHDPLLQKPDHRTLQLISTSLITNPKTNFVKCFPSGTFKIQKKTLQDEGFDPKRTTDQIYYLDMKSSKYCQVTERVYSDITLGNISV